MLKVWLLGRVLISTPRGMVTSPDLEQQMHVHRTLKDASDPCLACSLPPFAISSYLDLRAMTNKRDHDSLPRKAGRFDGQDPCAQVTQAVNGDGQGRVLRPRRRVDKGKS